MGDGSAALGVGPIRLLARPGIDRNSLGAVPDQRGTSPRPVCSWDAREGARRPRRAWLPSRSSSTTTSRSGDGHAGCNRLATMASCR
jgi:hypothetical protein